MSDKAAAAADPAAGGSGTTAVFRLQQNWGWIALRAVLLFVFGVLALLYPFSAVLAMTVLFGAFAFVDGVLSLVTGIRHVLRKEERWWSLILRGVLGIFAGLVVLIMPQVATVALVAFNWGMIALWALSAGLFEVAAGWRLRHENGAMGWLMVASGLASLLLGVAVPVVVILVPAAGVVAMGMMTGAYALVAGSLLAVLAWKLRKLEKAGA